MAASTEDAFDAAISALVRWEHASELGQLPELSDDGDLLEGVIWYPREANVIPAGRPDLARALTRALEWHGDQHRKGKPAVPYIGHLMGVAAIVIEAGGDSTMAVASLLHDALEDQPELVTQRLLEAEFGAEVGRIVRECSDSDPATSDEARDEATWLARKNLYVHHLNNASLDALKVSLADKLYNARAIRMDQAVRGDAFWEPFNAKLEAQLRYYRGLVGAFESREDLDGTWRHLVKELSETVEAIASKC